MADSRDRSRSPRMCGQQKLERMGQKPYEEALRTEYVANVSVLEHLEKLGAPCELTEAYFTSKPKVLVIGPTSSAKTTLIEHFIGGEYPGSVKGPEPTTDKFVCLIHGEAEGSIPGRRLVQDKHLPFVSLQGCEIGFLDHLRCAHMPSAFLRDVIMIDTPGVLSSSVQRAYDMEEAIDRLAMIADMVLIVLDINRLDLCDELKTIILNLYENGHKDKVNIVMNKADQKTPLELHRAYGALMWGLGQVIGTAEIPRVYVGSFWSQPLKNEHFRLGFAESIAKLASKFKELSRATADRKYQDVVDRAKRVRLHSYLMAYVRQQLPRLSLFWTKHKQKTLVNTLTHELHLDREKRFKLADHISEQELPNLKDKLASMDLYSFPEVPVDRIHQLEQSIEDLPKIACLISTLTWPTIPPLSSPSSKSCQKASECEPCSCPAVSGSLRM